MVNKREAIRIKGFTLAEIMVVVCIIALLSAIAIPSLLRARITANEAAAQATLRTISAAIETYAAANNGAYPTTAQGEAVLLSPTANPPYLNKAYDTLTVYGYIYAYTFGTGTTYLVTARPAAGGTTGSRAFSICTGGVLKESAVGTYTAPACP
jgi:type II secretion system protein G